MYKSLELEDRISVVEGVIEKARYMPRVWGGKLEETYEWYWSLFQQVCNEGWSCKDEKRIAELCVLESLYWGIMQSFTTAHPELILWSHAVDISMIQ